MNSPQHGRKDEWLEEWASHLRPTPGRDSGDPWGYPAAGATPQERNNRIAIKALLGALAVGLVLFTAVVAWPRGGGAAEPTDRLPQPTETVEPAPVPTDEAQPTETVEPAPEPSDSAQHTQSLGVPSDAQAATVVAVVDGDTVDTDMGRVRVHGIDTPEVGEPLSAEATAYIAAAVPVGGTIWLWHSPGADDTDVYGRLIRVVYTPLGRDVGAQLVAAGLASAYLQYSDAYAPEQAAAQEAGLGMWASGRGASAGEVEGIDPTDDLVPGAAPDASKPASDLASQPWNQPGPDLDCADISGGPVQVLRPDYHRLDRDGDGWGCEPY